VTDSTGARHVLLSVLFLVLCGIGIFSWSCREGVLSCAQEALRAPNDYLGKTIPEVQGELGPATRIPQDSRLNPHQWDYSFELTEVTYLMVRIDKDGRIIETGEEAFTE